MLHSLKWFLAILVLALVCVGAHSLYRLAMNTPMPKQAKLVDCTGAVVTCSFTPRKAYAFAMVLAPAYCEFAGQVQISTNGQQVVNFEIDSARAEQCNWLQSQGIPEGWILTSRQHRTNWPGLSPYFTPGKEHRITFSFQRPPTTNSSIWMTWLEHYGDVRKN